MAKKKAPLATGAISALQQRRIVDRSDRIVKPVPGIKEEVDEKSENIGNPLMQTTEMPQDATLSLKDEPLKPVPGQEDKPGREKKRVGRTTSRNTGVVKDKTEGKQPDDVPVTEKDNSKPHALSVLLSPREYAMYFEIIEKVNALGPPKKIAGTDIQRASIHLLHKMSAEKILKAHLQSMMVVGASTDKNDKKALSVLLQPREYKIFSKIIKKINDIGVSKKITGTDIQRASIYILHTMKPDKIMKAHYHSWMP